MIDPQVVRAAVLDTAGVLEMHPGPHGTAATFTAGGRVWGVRLDADRIDVHIVAESGRPLAALGRSVQHAVRRALPDYGGPVVVHVEDVTVPQPTAQDGLEPAIVVERTEEPRRTP